MPIKINSASGGSVTLDVPATGSTYTHTLPAESGTIITTGTLSGINATAMSVGTIPRSRMPAGTVLQMVHNNTYCNESTTTNGLVTASVNISITPYFDTSKIFIFFDILIYNFYEPYITFYL